MSEVDNGNELVEQAAKMANSLCGYVDVMSKNEFRHPVNDALYIRTILRDKVEEKLETVASVDK